MDWRLFATVFATIFLAEVGDKTMLAVVGFTASGSSPLAVFAGGALALGLTTLLGVLFGAGLARIVPVRVLHFIAASGFVVIGLLLFIKTIRSP